MHIYVCKVCTVHGLYAPLAMVWQQKGCNFVPSLLLMLQQFLLKKFTRSVAWVTWVSPSVCLAMLWYGKEKVVCPSPPICFLFACVLQPKWITKSEVLAIVVRSIAIHRLSVGELCGPKHKYMSCDALIFRGHESLPTARLRRGANSWGLGGSTS